LSKLIETRAEFQELAETRLKEAKALLDLGMWNGSYYLAGYAVEVVLKACIIKDGTHGVLPWIRTQW
jgi:HEPN domain-containing protein